MTGADSTLTGKDLLSICHRLTVVLVKSEGMVPGMTDTLISVHELDWTPTLAYPGSSATFSCLMMGQSETFLLHVQYSLQNVLLVAC